MDRQARRERREMRGDSWRKAEKWMAALVKRMEAAGKWMASLVKRMEAAEK